MVPRPWLRVRPKHYGGWCGSRIRNTPDSAPQPYLRSCLAPAHVRSVPDPSPSLGASASVYLLPLRVLRILRVLLPRSPWCATHPSSSGPVLGCRFWGIARCAAGDFQAYHRYQPRNVPAWFRGAGSRLALGITEVVMNIESDKSVPHSESGMRGT